MFGRRFLTKSPKSNRRDSARPFHRRPGFECLERREMLSAGNLLAEFAGVLSQSGSVERIPVTIAPENVGIIGDKVFMGFQAQNQSGNLDPAAVQIRAADGTLIKPEYTIANLAGKTDSVVLAGLAKGDYTLEVSGTAGTGQYKVGVFLAGDVDGDHAVAQDDLTTVQQIYGSKAGDSRYQLTADANLDGRINAIDLSLARRNLASSDFAAGDTRSAVFATNVTPFAEFVGLLEKSSGVERIPVTVSPENLGITGDKVFLGFQVQSRSGSSFDPAAITIRTAHGTVAKPEYTTPNLSGRTDSVMIAGLGAGNYTLEISGSVVAKSQYEVNVFLVGDVNGDHVVGQNDLDTVGQIYGSVAGDGRYQLSADANLDGRINAIDLSLARRNQAASQPVMSSLSVVACGLAATALASEDITSGGGVSDRVAAVTPTAGYDLDAPMQFFESTKGWVQPLASTYAPQGGVYHVPGTTWGKQTIVVDWTSREAGYGNDLVVFRVDDINGTINGISPGQSGYASAAAGRALAALDAEDCASKANPDKQNTLPNPHVASFQIQGDTYFSFYLVQGTYKDTQGQYYHWFPFSAANVDGYQHFQSNGNTFSVEDLSNNTGAHPNPGGFTNDADFNDVVFTVSMDSWTRQGDWTTSSAIAVAGSQYDTVQQLAYDITGSEADASLLGNVGQITQGTQVDVTALVSKMEQTLRDNVKSAALADKFAHFPVDDEGWNDGEGLTEAQVNAIFTSGDESVDCTGMATIVTARGLITSIHSGEFDALWNTSSMPLASRSVALGNTLNGDWVYFANDPNYLYRFLPDERNPGPYQGENAIKVGSDQYWGWALGTKSYATWKAILIAAYNDGLPDEEKITNIAQVYDGTAKFLDVGQISMDLFGLRTGA